MSKPKEYTCFLCKQKTSEYVEYKNKKYHKECMEKKERMDEEQREWEELYEYVFYKIMRYVDGMKMPRFMVLRLKGLRDGVFISNKNQKSQKHYSYKSILLTFKAKFIDISRAIDTLEFKNEQHKFNYIMIIIENSINDIVIRLKKVYEEQKKIDDIDVEDISLSNDKYEKFENPQKKDKIAERFNNLW